MSNEVRIVITAQDKGAKKAVDDVTKSADDADKKMGSFMGSVKRAAGALGLMVSAGKVMDLTFKAGFERLLTIEDAEKKMTQMGLSTDEVSSLMQGLTDTVTGTAFSLDAGADIMARFVAAGMPLDEVNKRLEMTADTAAFAQAPLQDIGNIFQRIQSEGKLTGETLNMLQVRGVPALDLLASAAGVSGDAMRDMISSGGVDAERFFGLWEQGSQGFGENSIRIAGAAKSMGDTIRGSLANAETALARAGAEIVERFLPTIRNLADGTKDAADAFISISQGVDGFNEKTKSLIETATGTEFDQGMFDEATWNTVTFGLYGVVTGLKDWVTGADEAERAQRGHSDGVERSIHVLERQAEAQSDAAVETRDWSDAIKEADDALKGLMDSLFEAEGGVLSLEAAEDKLEAAIDKATETIKDNGKALDSNTEEGRANRAALRDISSASHDLVEQQIKQGRSTEEVERTMRRAREQFIGAAMDAGLSEKAAKDLADQYGLIPKDVKTKVEVINVAQTRQRLANIRSWLDGIRDKTVTITARANIPQGVSIRQLMEMRQGGIVGSAQGGGPRGSRVLVGEAGPEVVDLPFGSRVIPSVDQATDRGQGGNGSGPADVRVTLVVDGLEDKLVEALRQSLRVRGERLGG